MAKETKVGLLAGLAFIICFAVILTNKGSDASAIPAPSVLSDAGSRVPAAMQQPTSRSAASPSLADRAAYPDGGHGAELRFVDPSGRSPQTIPGYAGTLPTQQSVPDGSNAADPYAQTLRERPLTASTGAASTSPPLAPPLQQSNDTAKPTTPVVTNSKPYTVAAGDTLSKIALAQYGTKSRSTVQAIFEANRTLLQNSDVIRPGMTLNLPELARAEPPPRAATAKPVEKPRTDEPKANTAKKSAEPSDAGARWYQVRKNDRWASIAREQLGDASRWKELHTLNKDKFPDPQKIREGVRIKLPGARLLASAEGRR